MGRRKTISDEDLLARAREVFVERGFAGTTREVSRRAGVSEALLFQRHATKADLFFAAMELPAIDLQALLDAPIENARDHVAAVIAAMIDYFRDSMPVLLPLLSHPGFEFEAFARRHPDSPLSTLRRGLVTFFASQRQAGRIGSVDPGAAALLVFALAESVAFFERLGAHGGRMPDAVLERVIEALWHGLSPTTDRRSGATTQGPGAHAHDF
jgi:AcrR family transcriptional regulator